MTCILNRSIYSLFCFSLRIPFWNSETKKMNKLTITFDMIIIFIEMRKKIRKSIYNLEDWR